MVDPSPSPSPGPSSSSMANRGRYNSFSSNAGNMMDNSPRRMRKRREPTPFNILIIGAKNCGKSSLLNLLRSSLAAHDDSHDGKSGRKNGKNVGKGAGAQDERSKTAASVSDPRLFTTFSSQYVESRIENEDFGITIWDSEGLVESMIDLQLREIVTFLESKFEETFDEEVKLVRDPGARDSQIHCVFYLLDPARIELKMAATSSTRRAIVSGKGGKIDDNDDDDDGGSDLTTTTMMMMKMRIMMEGEVVAAAVAPQRGEADDAFLGGLDAKFDLQALQMLCEKTTVIPVISKADTVTLAQMSYLKRALWESIRANGLDPFDIINRNSPSPDYATSHSQSSGPPSSLESFSECRSYSVGVDDEEVIMMMKNKNRAVGKKRQQSSRSDGKGKNSSKTIKSPSLSSSSSSSPLSPLSPLSSSSSSSYASSSSATSAPSGTTEAGDVNNNNKNNGSLLAKQHHRLHEPPPNSSTTTYNITTTPPPAPPILPLSIISPDVTYNQGFPGRKFPWGSAETNNPLHCDFSRLKELVFVEWRDEMREASRVLWYERWRTARLGRCWNNNNDTSMSVRVDQIQHHHQH